MTSLARLPRFIACLLTAGLATTATLAAAVNLEWTAAPARFTDEENTHAEIRFSLRNPTDTPLIIHEMEPSCGCTVVEAPARPWTLAPQGEGTFVTYIDLRGKRGELHKTIRLVTSAGPMNLPVKVQIPNSPMASDRLQNQLVALRDAQAIFRDDCARCHAAPAAGKSGRDLYLAACAICHEAHPRAEVVPDLQAVTKGKTAEYLLTWITEGKPGTFMPAFAKDKGGILDQAQIDSLVDFLRHRDPPSSTP